MWQFKGRARDPYEMEVLSLQNNLLRVQILPSIGGKIVSLRSVRTGEEFLLPPIHDYKHVSASAAFSESDGGGFDECLPSIASCESLAGLPAVADHGDLWRQPWQAESNDEAIVLHADATSRPLRLTRRATLEGAALVLDYDLVNLSNEPTQWLWSAHPLLHVAAGDRIVLPEEIKRVSVEYSAGELFEKDISIGWPRAQSVSGVSMDLSKVGKRDGITAHKLFAEVEKSGWAGLYRDGIKQGVVVRFDPNMLPFLGLWICSEAWPAGGIEKQYTVALEPTTSKTDSLATAIQNGTARTLNGLEHVRWRLELHLIGAAEAMNFDDFSTAAASDNRGFLEE